MKAIQRAKQTLTIMAFATLFGCTSNLPASTPTTDMILLELHSTRSTQALTRELAQAYQDTRPDFDFDLYTDTYANLISQLHSGQISYFISGFVPSNDSIWAAPIAQDGLVMITHVENPVSNLSAEDVRRIYGGRMPNWELLGGDNQEIIVLTVDTNTDTFSVFERLVMGHRPITANAQVVPNLGAMLAQVSEFPGSIGYVPMSMVQNSVRTLSIDGITPTQISVTNNEYPLRSTIFVIGRQEPQDHYRAFLGWIQSKQGQAIVSASHVALP